VIRTDLQVDTRHTQLVTPSLPTLFRRRAGQRVWKPRQDPDRQRALVGVLSFRPARRQVRRGCRWRCEASWSISPRQCGNASARTSRSHHQAATSHVGTGAPYRQRPYIGSPPRGCATAPPPW